MVGLLTLGRRVLVTARLKIARLSITSAIATQMIIVALNIAGTLYGLPLSGTHISIACLIGAGLATKTAVDYKVCRNILLYWLITLPGEALFSILFAYLPSGIIFLERLVGYS
jgi:phosphate/sulfate permease